MADKPEARDPTDEEAQATLDTLEREGKIYRTGEYRNGQPLYTVVPEKNKTN